MKRFMRPERSGSAGIRRKIFRIEKETDLKTQARIALISAIASLGCNTVLDPLVGYFYKVYLFGIPLNLAAELAKISSATTLANAVCSVLFVFILWPALYAALSRSGMLFWNSPENRPESSERS